MVCLDPEQTTKSILMQIMRVDVGETIPLVVQYRGSSLIRNCHPPGPYSRPIPRALGRSKWGGVVSHERDTPTVHYRAKEREARPELQPLKIPKPS